VALPWPAGKRGADVRPDFDWNKKPVGAIPRL